MRFLFERLVTPGKAPGIESLKEDVRAQVQRLVDSHRIALHRGALDIMSMSMPSAIDLGRDSGSEQKQYADRLCKLIKRYEPRLMNPQVAVMAANRENPNPHLLIQAQLQIDSQLEEFRFVAGVSG